MGHIMREDKKLKNPKNNTGNQSDTPLALSWDTLPDLAKNRWEEAVAFDVTVENQLAKAKSDRTLAETERQRIAKEILDATKDVCKEIITDGQRALNRAMKMEAEAAKNTVSANPNWINIVPSEPRQKVTGPGYWPKWTRKPRSISTLPSRPSIRSACPLGPKRPKKLNVSWDR